MRRCKLDILTTDRLTIRPFRGEDLAAIHRILNAAFGANDSEADMRAWLDWSILSARWFPLMHQPPYGDRAITLRETDEVIGAVGYVPLLMPFDQIPELARPGSCDLATMSAEVGLFWAIDPPLQRRGYATEAARAMIDYAFDELRVWRIVAATQYTNHASQAVMLKAGMTLTRNPHAEPAWMQVVGVRHAEAHLGQEGLLT